MVFDSRNTAKDVLLNSTLQSNIGAVSSFDQSDFHRFQVGTGSGSSAYISLSGLKADANIVLMNSNGQVISSSQKAGLSPEAIKADLLAGTYYIQVLQRSGNTAYTLSISSSALFASIDDNVKFATGDFNGDRLQDVIRQEQGLAINGVKDTQFYTGKAGGGYNAGVDITNMGAVAGNVANLIVGDFNGDGRDDLIRQEFGSHVNGVNDAQILAFKDGNFQVVANMPNMALFNGNFTNLIAGDFNQDGRTDLIRQEKGAWVNGQSDVQIHLSTGGWNFSPVQIGSNASLMTGNDTQLVASGADIMRLELAQNVNGINDVNFTSFANGSLTPFQLAATGNFSNAVVPKPWEAPIAALYQTNAATLGNLVGSSQNAIASPQGTAGRFRSYEQGGIYWSAKTGAVVVSKEMNNFYRNQFGNPVEQSLYGTPTSSAAVSSNWLGLPTGKPQAWNGGTRQDFEGGYLFQDGTQVVALRPNEMPQFSSPVGKFRAEFFNNNSLSGQPTFTRIEDAVNTNWNAGGPGNGIGNDNFSVRWTGKFNFEGGNYKFSNGVDDGMRVWIDGKIVHDSWVVRNSIETSWNVAMTAGLHDIKVEYREDGGMAMARMLWEKAPSPSVNLPEVKMTDRNIDYSRGSSWVSSSGHKFIFQTDGNVVLYNNAGKALWATGTANTSADRFSIQADGNVVLYDGNRAVWASNTAGNPGSRFVVQSDGNVVVYGGTGLALFNTGTVGDQSKTLTASPIWVSQYTPASPAASTGKPFTDAINRVGGTQVVGTAINAVHAWGDGQVQDFRNTAGVLGILMQSNGSNVAYWVNDEFLNFYYNRLQGAAGPLGYPTSDRYLSSGLWKQDFQYGNIVKNSQGALIETISPNSPVKLAPTGDLAFINARFDEFAKLNSSALGKLLQNTYLWGNSPARLYENANLVWEKGTVEFRALTNAGNVMVQYPAPVTTPPSGATPNPVSTVSQSPDFLGTVKPSVGLNVRSGPGTGYSVVRSLVFGSQITFDTWTRGTSHTDPSTGLADDRWFRIKGTNNWVASAFINGNPGTGVSVSNGVTNVPSGILVRTGGGSQSDITGSKGGLILTGGGIGSGTYYPELSGKTDEWWDLQSGDSDIFDKQKQPNEFILNRDKNLVNVTPDVSVKKVFTDLSSVIFKGNRHGSSSGYAYDGNYVKQTGLGQHSGIDIDNYQNANVHSATDGTIFYISRRDEFGSGTGIAVAVKEKLGVYDTGRIWWYFHLGQDNGSNALSVPLMVGQEVEGGKTSFGTNMTNGTGKHLHLTVTTEKTLEAAKVALYNNPNQKVVVGRTISPLQAYWEHNQGITRT
jgi:hypothetical protein